MISVKGLDYIKAISESQADMIPGGVIYVITEGDTITWRKASKAFDLDIFNVGEKIKENSIAARAIKEKKTIAQNIPRALYGIRLKTNAEPITDADGEVVGAFSMVFPRLHPVAKGFGDFAPIICEMFPEGSFMYMTDLEKAMYRQPSKKFDMPALQVGTTFNEDDSPNIAIRTKKPVIEERDKSRFGIPVLEACYPLFDEDNPSEVVCTIGIFTPKEVAANLREMSGNLESGLGGISAAIQQLAASAAQIHNNEQELNKEIKEITSLSEEINEVSSFIKDIADETKMQAK